MDRRGFLRATASTTLGLVGASHRRSDGETRTRIRSTAESTILPGTRHETPVFVTDGGDAGPTVVVVGGMHGDEPSGARAAARVADWGVMRGTLVVVPRANVVALDRGTRHGTGGDLNRQFPPETAPQTRLARALWAEITRHDPDAVVDLHSSKGIYGFHQEFVGQAVFPASVDDAPAHADDAVTRANDLVPWYMPFHTFQRGSTIGGDAPLLAHKAVASLGVPSYIVESTKFVTDLETRVSWTTAAARTLVERAGVDPRPTATDGGESA